MNVIEESLYIKLEGSDDIDINTLKDVLVATVETFKELSDDGLENGNARKFVVKDVVKGSFILEIVEYIVANPMTSIGYAATTLGAFKTILEIKKHLKGESPKSIERNGPNVIIENSENISISFNQFPFDQYSNNEDIDNGINKILKASSEGDSRNGITIESSSGDKVSFDKNESRMMSKKVDLMPFTPDIVDEKYDKVKIRLSSSDFDGNKLWGFYMMGRKYNGKMEDEEFIKALSEGRKSINGQTVLEVDLVCRYRTDSNGELLRNEKPKFYIKKVY
ncbi:hypothetical protein [Erysipelothrix anatis]|uniref:hypothetical protein n=1 Tax=Erysipelothrix anatis TaxID=2683713 RepID=UPI00135A8C5F|nr:hypothetical protein [Erysipelothrix anatis]